LPASGVDGHYPDMTTSPPIVLASGSPRRFDLLSSLGVAFTVATSGVDEAFAPGIAPEELVAHLAERKARAVAETLPAGLVIGADTTVAIDGDILNKPVDAAEARRMLRQLRGRTHAVWTGIALIDAATDAGRCSAVRSLVRMRGYTDDEIDAYVTTGEPLDKAGAYAIQGGAGVFVQAIEGCYANVVGLPLCELAMMLVGAAVVVPLHGPVCTRPDGTSCPRLALAHGLIGPRRS
jgi:septum formation protein